METAVYVRVSTHRQAQAQTIEQQLERLHAQIQAQGGALLDENIFRDDGYSGATLNRPGLDRLRDRAAQAESGPQVCPSSLADRRTGTLWLSGRVP